MSITDSAHGVPLPVIGVTTLHNARQKTHGIYHCASMEFDMRHGTARDEPAECVQNYLDPAMQGDLVHLVEGPIH